MFEDAMYKLMFGKLETFITKQAEVWKVSPDDVYLMLFLKKNSQDAKKREPVIFVKCSTNPALKEKIDLT